jgi:hypothetical protein
MKTITLLSLLIICTAASAQLQLSFGGGLGYMANTNSPSAQLKGQAIFLNRISVEGSAAFSRSVPFEHSVKIGYLFNPYGRLQIIPGIANTKYTFANHDKHLNYSKYRPAIEVSYQISLEGTYGQSAFNHIKLFADHIGTYTGVGLRFAFTDIKL